MKKQMTKEQVTKFNKYVKEYNSNIIVKLATELNSKKLAPKGCKVYLNYKTAESYANELMAIDGTGRQLRVLAYIETAKNILNGYAKVIGYMFADNYGVPTIRCKAVSHYNLPDVEKDVNFSPTVEGMRNIIDRWLYELTLNERYSS